MRADDRQLAAATFLATEETADEPSYWASISLKPLTAVDHLLRTPVGTTRGLADSLSITPQAALGLLRQLIAAGIAREATGRTGTPGSTANATPGTACAPISPPLPAMLAPASPN